MRSEKADSNLNNVRRVINLEDFKNCLLHDMKLHLEDQHVSTCKGAVDAADRFDIVHKT